ncbi:hypothetical protein BC833DRAFT_626469 [Globomyces pollinis-pini]|nr:hypothetical protein BC833DRAFT_626469 [Globomyces pollinis-pini]
MDMVHNQVFTTYPPSYRNNPISITNFISHKGVWRVRMDAYRLVNAVQREDQCTWFEILDFNEHPDIGSVVETLGDQSLGQDDLDFDLDFDGGDESG